MIALIISVWGDWQPYGWPCADYQQQAIVMTCEAGAIYGAPLDVRHGWRVSVDVRATPAADGRFWCGLALNADLAADDRYAEVAVEKGIAPYSDDTRAYGVQLSTPADRCCERMIEAGDGWHHLEIVYQAGRADYQIDDTRASAAIDLGDTAVVELLAVAVDPGEVKPGNRATCEWRNVAITPLHTSYLPLAIVPAGLVPGGAE